MPEQAEVTKHDNAPVFEVGKAYRLTDGTKRRVLVKSIETKRIKCDEVEFNQHTYKAIVIERGDKLTIRESALLATVKEKPVRVTKAELAKFMLGESEVTGDAPSGESPPTAEPESVTSGNAQQRESEEPGNGTSDDTPATDEGSAVTPLDPDEEIELRREVLQLRQFRDDIHEQWNALGLPSNVSLVSAVEDARETARLEATGERDKTIARLDGKLETVNGWLAKYADEKEASGLPLGKPIDQGVAELLEAERLVRADAGLENADLVADLLEKERETVKALQARVASIDGGELVVCEDGRAFEVSPPPRAGVFIPDGLSWYQLGRFVGTRLIREPSIVVDAAQVKTIGGHPTVREDTPEELAAPETEQAGSDAHEQAPVVGRCPSVHPTRPGIQCTAAAPNHVGRCCNGRFHWE
jgi:hypothetical protein